MRSPSLLLSPSPTAAPMHAAADDQPPPLPPVAQLPPWHQHALAMHTQQGQQTPQLPIDLPFSALGTDLALVQQAQAHVHAQLQWAQQQQQQMQQQQQQQQQKPPRRRASPPPPPAPSSSSSAAAAAAAGPVKARKPYVIQKARELWTDEEHEQFEQILKQSVHAHTTYREGSERRPRPHGRHHWLTDLCHRRCSRCLLQGWSQLEAHGGTYPNQDDNTGQ